MDTRDFVNRINLIARGYQHAQILFAAVRADVFRFLESPRNATELADALGWNARSAQMLLDGLLALELVTLEDARYRNVAMASMCLVPGAPADQTHIMRHIAGSYEPWGLLEESLKTGAPALCERDRDPEALRAFILGMADLTRHAAPGVIAALDLAGRRRLLDIGTGPGAYSIAFLEAHPHLHATLFDLPQVIEITREQVDAAGLSGRVTYRPGDLTQDSFGDGYDIALLSNIIHSFGPEENRALVRKCYECLAPGGLLVIKDFLLNPGRSGPPFSLVFALHMHVHTPAGGTYTVDEAADWTRAAGFRTGRFIDLGLASRLWLAEK